MVIKSNLCDYSDANILVTGDITVRNGNEKTKVPFKNCAPFTKWLTHINDEHVDNADNLEIVMSMYILIEYSGNYSDTLGNLCQFKRDKQGMDNINPIDTNADNSSFLKYKTRFFKAPTAADNGVFKNVEIAVPLKYLSNFLRSSETPLIDCQIHLEFNWSKDCVMSSVVGATEFKITSTKWYVPIITLSSKGNSELVKLLEDGFNRPVYWNEYQTKIETRNLDDNNLARFPLDASFQGVRRLFILVFNNTDDNAKQVERNNHRKYFLPRVNITNYNVLIDRRNFYDQPINIIKQYNKIIKIATRRWLYNRMFVRLSVF